MATSLTLEIDGTKMREALEGESLRTVLKGFVRTAARVSADNIAREAQARLQRQLRGTSSGRTVAGITVLSDRTGWGWVVVSGNADEPMLPHWLEHGTVTMHARSYFDASATLEASAHRERVGAAIQAGLSEYGLGDSR